MTSACTAEESLSAETEKTITFEEERREDDAGLSGEEERDVSVSENTAAQETAQEADREADRETDRETEQDAGQEEDQARDAETMRPEIVVTYDKDGYKLSNDASDFVILSEVIPDVILEIRYYSTYNFVGDRIDGYEEPIALLTKEAAEALLEVSEELAEKGYRLKIYDAYRPRQAVTHFLDWAADATDVRMKEFFYPNLDKSVLISGGYVSKHSGHSRGSTVDLTLFDVKTGKEVDMGGTFDYFGELSHPDYAGITEEQRANRTFLRKVMMNHGFKPISSEWWHFTLKNEPFPDTYFTFPVNSNSTYNN